MLTSRVTPVGQVLSSKVALAQLQRALAMAWRTIRMDIVTLSTWRGTFEPAISPIGGVAWLISRHSIVTREITARRSARHGEGDLLRANISNDLLIVVRGVKWLLVSTHPHHMGIGGQLQKSLPA